MRVESVSKTALVMGIGNILKKDDGAGVHTVNYLLGNYPDIEEHAEIIDGGTAGIDLMEYMIPHSHVIIIDSLKADSEPGSIYRFPAENLTGAINIYSQHQAGLNELIKMIKLAGHDLSVEIFGIVPADIKSDEIGLSPAVEDAVSKAAAMIYESVIAKSAADQINN